MTILTKNEHKFRRMTPEPYPGNDREFIVDCPFQFAYAAPGDWNWRFIPDLDGTPVETRAGYSPLAVWQSPKDGAAITMRGEIEADLADFAFLRVRVLAGRKDTVSIRAEIDGRLVDICGPETGTDDYGEYAGPIHGLHLSAVEIRCQAGAPGPVTNSVMWVMLVKAGNPTPLQQPDPEWPGLLVDAATGTPSFVPTLNLLMDAGELEEIRSLVKTPQWTESWAKTVAAAERAAEMKPETTTNPVIPRTRERYGRPDALEWKDAPDPQLLAFVGLVEKRADLLQLAARWALTWTLCKRWVHYGIEYLGTHSTSHGRFAQAHTASIASLVLDWCGTILTPKGRAVLGKAIHDLGVCDIDGIMSPNSYVWGCNQGIVFEYGRFIGAYAVREWYPEEYSQREADALRMVSTCLNACMAPDGSSHEGSAYWLYTMDNAIPLIALLARASGRHMADITPACVTASGRWALANLRTDSDEWLMIPHADSSFDRRIGGLLTAFLAGPLGLNAFTEHALRHRETVPAYRLPLYWSFLREAKTGGLNVPSLTVFPDSGQVDVRQDDPKAGLRLYFLSGRRKGHCHDDKNSFILEAYGKLFLLDRGTPVYTHPACTTAKETQAHNSVAPDGLSQNVSPHSGGGAMLLRAEERNGNDVIIESDAAGCWPHLAKKALRRLVHIRPATLVVEDEAEWEKPVITGQYWQSLGEWQRHGDGWIVKIDDAELLATVLHPRDADVSIEKYSVDGNLRPVHRLVVSTPRATAGRIVTLFRVRRNAQEPWPGIPDTVVSERGALEKPARDPERL